MVLAAGLDAARNGVAGRVQVGSAEHHRVFELIVAVVGQLVLLRIVAEIGAVVGAMPAVEVGRGDSMYGQSRQGLV